VTRKSNYIIYKKKYYKSEKARNSITARSSDMAKALEEEIEKNKEMKIYENR